MRTKVFAAIWEIEWQRQLVASGEKTPVIFPPPLMAQNGVTLIPPKAIQKKEVFMSSEKCCSLHAVYEPLNAGGFSACSRALLFCGAIWIGLNVGNASAQSAAPPSSAFELRTVAQPENQADLKRRQIEFLNRIRKADPQRRTIERALFNDQNELGLILNRSVEMDKIPALMRSMLAQMAREFPGQDLTVLAYTPSNPPRKIGTARFNARTRDMTYTRER
jgi:hypothetical protein